MLLAIQTDEQGLPQLKHSLFIKEIKKINPKLAEGCLVVDGLYELVCQKVVWPECTNHSDVLLRGAPHDITNNTGSLLLQRYWQRPTDPAELSQYLTIGASFVQFLHDSYGSSGVSKFLQQLDCSKREPFAASFRFKGNKLLDLEYKWKNHLEAEVSKKYRLSLLGMVWHLLAHYLIRYWCKLFLVILILLLDLVITLAFAVFSGRVFQLGFTEENMVKTTYLACVLVGLLLARFFLLNAGSALLVSMALDVSKKLRCKVLARLHAVSPQFLLDHSRSSVISSFTHDVEAIETLVAASLRAFTRALLMLLTCLVFSFAKAWPLGVGLIIAFLSSQLLISCLSSITAKISFARSQALNKVSSILQESVDGFTENRLFCSEYYWRLRLEQVLRCQYLPATCKMLFIAEFVTLSQQLAALAIGLFLIIGTSLLSVYGIVEFETGVTIFLFYGPTMVSVATAASMFNNVQAARVGLGRINALLHNPDHTVSAPSSHPLVLPLEERMKGVSVEFQNVCHCYSPTASHWTLYNVSFIIPAGKRAVLVGESGSGKSSILNLVLELYVPTSGRVLISGRETSGHPSKLAAATSQTNHIFQMSVRDNIKFGNLVASDKEVEKVAKQADIHSWVMSMPCQYDTVVRPSTLSGGQKQRIAIARMLLANSPVLVLDEVTSALDPTTECKLFRTLMDVTKGRTVIAATHRMEQAKHFDQILVISHGQIKETGTHAELMAECGAYYRMVTRTKRAPSPHKATPIRHQHSLSHLTTNPLSVYAFTPSPSSPKASQLPRSTASRLYCPTVPSPLITQVAQHTTQLQTAIDVEDSNQQEQWNKYEEAPIPSTFKQN